MVNTTVPLATVLTSRGPRALAAILTLFASLAVMLGPTRASADEYIDGWESFSWVIMGHGYTLGPPDGNYLEIGYVPDDDPYPLPSSITLVFKDNVAYDGPGADLRVYAIDDDPYGTVYIEVSYGGTDYVSAGVFTDDRGNIELDLATLGLSAATHLRFTNASGPFGWYGFNLDAVEALHSFETDTIAFTLDPPTDSSPGFEEHTVLTSVNDGDPVDGIRVSYAIVDGPNAGLTGLTTTYANGLTSFAWTGDGTEGIDTLEAWLDLDADGVPDEGEPFATATKQWRNGVTGAIAIADLGGGTIEVTVTDADLDITNDLDTISIPIVSTSDTNGITITLTETDLHSGIFTATFNVGTGELVTVSTASSTSYLIAIGGDEVTASYDDVIDANNEDPPPVTASLIIGASETEHIAVCHVPPGNAANQRTITIGAAAVAAHLGHGDIEGECAPIDLELLPKQHGAPDDHGAPNGNGGGLPEGKGKPPK